MATTIHPTARDRRDWEAQGRSLVGVRVRARTPGTAHLSESHWSAQLSAGLIEPPTGIGDKRDYGWWALDRQAGDRLGQPVLGYPEYGILTPLTGCDRDRRPHGQSRMASASHVGALSRPLTGY